MRKLRRVYPIILMILVVACGKDDEAKKVIPCVSSDLADHVIAFYPFSNGSLNDIAGDGHHLTNTTTAKAATDRNGNANCAYEFDNLPTSSEFLSTSNTTFLDNLNEFSISLWYQPIDTSRSVGNFETLINRDLGNSCPDRNGQWSIALYDCRKAVFGRTNSVWDRNIANLGCHDQVIIRTGTWNHVVATFKQSGVEMRIFRNGILQESSKGDGDCGLLSKGYQDIGDLFLGKGYTGKIDDVIIFNKSLSIEEVNTLFNMETCCQ